MRALITGASSGIGKEMAYYLANMGIDLILVARSIDKLDVIKDEVDVSVKTIKLDLSEEKNVYKLYELTKNSDVDILINNAGFGLFGLFWKTDLDREMEMINVNIKALHILTKLFLPDFIKRDSGYILNVCSSAGFMAGPRLSTYYATKNYALKLTMAIHEELRQKKSNVSISALCPGPVDTNFNKVAKGEFSMKGLNASYVAEYAITNMFKKKMLIVPSFGMKTGLFFMRFLPYKLQLRIVYKIQYNKQKNLSKR